MNATDRHLRGEEIEKVAFAGSGDGHLDVHLGQCDRCAKAVALARARKKLLRAIPPAELDELAFRKIEARLFAPESVRPNRWAWLNVQTLVPLAAAAMLIVFFALRPSELAPGAPSDSRSAPRPLARAQASVVQGEVSYRADENSPWQPLEPGDLLDESSEVRAEQGRAAIVLGPGTGLVLAERSMLALTSLREGQTALSIESGRVACSVRPLTGDASFLVTAGTREVHVVGTAFAVARDESEVVVEVQHGVVALGDALDPSQQSEVRGPGRLAIDDGDSLRPTTPLSPEEAALLEQSSEWNLSLPSPPPLARLELRGLPRGSSIEVDRTGFGPAPWVGLLPPGSHLVRARQPGKPERELTLNLGAKGSIARLDQMLVERPSRAQPAPAPDAEDFSDAIHGHLGELRGCYEHWLKRDTEAGGSIVLELEIGAGGEVRGVAAKGLVLPDEMEACISKAAARWSLPAPGAPLMVEVPLRLTRR